MGAVKIDSDQIGVKEWKALVQNSKKWREIFMTAETLKEYSIPTEKEKERTDNRWSNIKLK